MTDIITRNGYRLDARAVFEAQADNKLVARASVYPGIFVLWDPNDDEDGYLIAGDSSVELEKEFTTHFEGFLS
ncbi:MAG: hypothetical protein EOQ39_18635 [Mesorhizobium sp.]|uniref:hypothetical protein n=1 Tax=Mesorhizobium sp. TaxID=1871066 RepID=UPI000FE56D4E|nr:hypothetical protein [Mesorhizobium sp.]RWB08813.1 MAG: hypothetical protein EOQ37_04710 [Mesorhizobium sp.]RWB13537.1 MAG: hypothetical protein EOQ39_18635 [Mesorhizobium sp.]